MNGWGGIDWSKINWKWPSWTGIDPVAMGPGGMLIRGFRSADEEWCPRIFETLQEEVIVQGYHVDNSSRPHLAHPPDAETQIRMPRKTFLSLAKWVLGHGEQADLLGDWQNTLFRVETLQTYLAESEAERWQAFREGKPMPPRSSSAQAWRQRIQETTKNGVHWQRVHVVDRPLSDYLLFELHDYADSVAVGYETLIADRSQHPELLALKEDFYLLDEDTENATAVLMHYDPEGHPLTMWRTTDPAAIEDCRDRRNLALRYAIPLKDFLAESEQPEMSIR